MKDFEEFRQFVLTDCMHEINAIGASLGTQYTDEDFNKIGMSVESLGTLLKMVGYVGSSTTMLLLERYHEWASSFPDENHEYPE